MKSHKKWNFEIQEKGTILWSWRSFFSSKRKDQHKLECFKDSFFLAICLFLRQVMPWKEPVNFSTFISFGWDFCDMLVHFFVQSVRINLAFPQAAGLSIFFYWKIISVAPPWETCIKDALLIEWRRKNPSTRQDSNPQPQELCSAGLCSTAVLQPLPTSFESDRKRNVGCWTWTHELLVHLSDADYSTPVLEERRKEKILSGHDSSHPP